MESLNIEMWKDFFVAVAGAASALAGLVFVALSINLTRILAMPGLPGRGAETLILLSTALLSSLLALIPGQSSTMLGLELGAVALFAWAGPSSNQIREGRSRYFQQRWHHILRMALHQFATLPLLVASASMIWGTKGGLFWLAFGIIQALIVSLVNAWVLLVEIMR